jgi:hypothetical protein
MPPANKKPRIKRGFSYCEDAIDQRWVTTTGVPTETR